MKLVIIVLLITMTSMCGGEVIFEDNFDNGPDPAWNPQWDSTGGTYGGSMGFSRITLFDNLTDFTVEVDVKSVDDGGLLLRGSMTGNYGVVLVTGGKGNQNYNGLYWHVNSGGWGPWYGHVLIPGFWGSDATIKVVVSGNTYSAYVNGSTTPSTVLTDSTYSSGCVGLYLNSNQRYDNFKLTVGPEFTLVPDVIYMMQIDAENTLVAKGLVVGEITHDYNDVIPIGHIMTQMPEGGTLVDAGSIVDLVVSDGPAVASVPNIVGMNETDARNAITGVGLSVGSISFDYSDIMPVDLVVNQNPEAGEIVDLGSEVNFILSLGCPSADLNEDCFVDINDLFLLCSQWLTGIK